MTKPGARPERGHEVSSEARPGLKLAVVVSFLNEAEHLPRLLASIARQTEPAEELLLIDDGSRDQSSALAEEFAGRHDYARALQRRRRADDDRDRLVDAPELQAFAWGVDCLTSRWEIVAKLDGDLELPSTLFAEVRQALADEPRLGIAGSYLSIIGPSGMPQREPNAPYHVRGPNKFYRRDCYEAITPLPCLLGWDGIDDLRARQGGWITRSFTPTSGDILHLRPTGAHDGRLRAFRRWGRCAWGHGAHPLWVFLGALARMRARPYGLTGINYLWGWTVAAIRRYPRAEPALLEYRRNEDLARIRAALRHIAHLRAYGHEPSSFDQ